MREPPLDVEVAEILDDLETLVMLRARPVADCTNPLYRTLHAILYAILLELGAGHAYAYRKALAIIEAQMNRGRSE